MTTNTRLNPKIKTPISYYGGKQMMLQHILPIIPEHSRYTESYVGGGAVFWAKEPARAETINDINGELINFYAVVQNGSIELIRLIRATLHSRKLYKQAMFIYDNPELFDPVKRAWAVWVCCTQGFSSMIGSWAIERSKGTIAKKVSNMKYAFDLRLYKERLESVQIECNDAIKVITASDSPEAFHYIDTPYPNSDCGHYSGYTFTDYERQMKCMEQLKGKFLHSSYPSEMLTDYVQRNGWYQREITKRIAVSHKAKGVKTEVLTSNYPI